MLNKKLLYITTVGLMSSVFSINTKAQSFYQCMSAIEEEDWNKTPILTASAGNCSTISVKPGLYLVYLRGGKGGDCDPINSSLMVDEFYDINKGKRGGYVEYKFKVDEDTQILLCAGGNGGNAQLRLVWVGSDGASFGGTGAGGGASSYIGIKGYAIVVGGGSGHECLKNGYTKSAGFGGFLGPGENGKTIYDANTLYLHNIKNGGYVVGSKPLGFYPGYINKLTENIVGTSNKEATATHQSNVSLKLGCQDPDVGCAELYSWRAN